MLCWKNTPRSPSFLLASSFLWPPVIRQHRAVMQVIRHRGDAAEHASRLVLVTGTCTRRQGLDSTQGGETVPGLAPWKVKRCIKTSNFKPPNVPNFNQQLQ